MAKTTTVKSSNDSVFTVRLVERGDRYGLHFCLIHFEPQPMVEFYDVNSRAACYDFVGPSDSAIAANAPRLGQFVTRYNVSTLLPDIASLGGLCLHGGIPAWQIDGSALRQAFRELGLWAPAALPELPARPLAPQPATAETEQAKIDAAVKDAVERLKATHDARLVQLMSTHETEFREYRRRRDREGVRLQQGCEAAQALALTAERRQRAAESKIEEMKKSDVGQLHFKYTTKVERLKKRNAVLTSRLSYWKRKNA
jgi:hypothetical protein